MCRSRLKRGKVSSFYFLWMLLVAGIGWSCSSSPAEIPKQELDSAEQSGMLEGEFWLRQAQNDIMPFWVKYSIDKKYGGYITLLTRKGEPCGKGDKFPFALSRQVYGFCAAYLLTGEDSYLELARHILKFLLEYGWDSNHGGWYHSLSKKGEVKDRTKRGFTQVYGNTGPTFYYFVTGDTKVLKYVEIANEIQQKHAWDKKYGGYFADLNDDLSVASDKKDWNPNIGKTGGYLIYLYLATGEVKYLRQLERIAELAIKHFFDPSAQLIETRPRLRDFSPVPQREGQKSRVSVGGNLETAWVLIRLYHLTGQQRYLNYGKKIAATALRYGYDDQYGGWYNWIEKECPEKHAETKDWWVHTVGSFLTLSLYDLTREQEYLEMFKKGAIFWTKYMIDHEYGAAYLRCNSDGSRDLDNKTHVYKNCYHSMEHMLFNYLYLNLLVKNKPVTLYFRLTAEKPGTKHYVCPVADKSVRLSSVTIDGNPWESFDPDGRYVLLPKGNEMKVVVTLEKVPGR